MIELLIEKIEGITDESIKELKELRTLFCFKCKGITDETKKYIKEKYNFHKNKEIIKTIEDMI